MKTLTLQKMQRHGAYFEMSEDDHELEHTFHSWSTTQQALSLRNTLYRESLPISSLENKGGSLLDMKERNIRKILTVLNWDGLHYLKDNLEVVLTLRPASLWTRVNPDHLSCTKYHGLVSQKNEGTSNWVTHQVTRNCEEWGLPLKCMKLTTTLLLVVTINMPMDSGVKNV